MKGKLSRSSTSGFKIPTRALIVAIIKKSTVLVASGNQAWRNAFEVTGAEVINFKLQDQLK